MTYRLLSFLFLLIGSLFGEEITYRPCSLEETSVEEAPGNTCVPVTVRRVLRSQFPQFTYNRIYKDLNTDAEGTVINLALSYLRNFYELNPYYINSTQATKDCIAEGPVPYKFKLIFPPEHREYLWVGNHRGGCHMALLFVDTAYHNGVARTTYTISNSERFESYFMEDILTAEEFFEKTMGMWEIKPRFQLPSKSFAQN